MIIDRFLPPMIRLIDMPSQDARYVLAARTWCVLRKAALEPHQRLFEILVSARAAQHFSILMDIIIQSWPEPFAVHRTCCPTPSLDERILITALRLAKPQSRAQFDAYLGEMLPCDARDILFTRASMLGRRLEP